MIKNLNRIQQGTSSVFLTLQKGGSFKEIKSKCTDRSERTLERQIAVLINFGLIEKKRKLEGALYYPLLPLYNIDDLGLIVAGICASGRSIFKGKFLFSDLKKQDYGNRIALEVKKYSDFLNGGTNMADGKRAKAEFDADVLRTNVRQIASLCAEEYARTHEGETRRFLKFDDPEGSKNWKAFVKLVKVFKKNGIETIDNRQLYIEALYDHYGWKVKGKRIYPYASMLVSDKAYEIYLKYLTTKKDLNYGNLKPDADYGDAAKMAISDSAMSIYDVAIQRRKKGKGNYHPIDVAQILAYDTITEEFAYASSLGDSEALLELRDEFIMQKDSKRIIKSIQQILPKVKKEVRERILENHYGEIDEEIYRLLW